MPWSDGDDLSPANLNLKSSGSEINARDPLYGADPSNTDDSTSSLQAFLNASHTGCVLVIPPGQYKVTSTLTLGQLDYVKVRADGAILYPSGASFTGAVLQIGDADSNTRTNFLDLSGLAIINNGATGVTAGIECNEMFNSTLREVVIQAVPGHGIHCKRKGYNNRLVNATVWLNGGCGLLDGTTGSGESGMVPFFVYGSRLEGNGQSGVYWVSDQFQAFGCTFQSNASVSNTSYDVDMAATTSYFHGCQFERSRATASGATRTMAKTNTGKIDFYGCVFSGARDASDVTGNVGIELGTAGKNLLMGNTFRDCDVGWAISGGQATIIGNYYSNNSVNFSDTGAVLLQNMGGQTNPTFKGTSVDFQGASLSNSSTGGRIDVSDNLGLTVSASSYFRVATSHTPTGTATGDGGRIAWDADYIYVCTSTNSWRRSALTTF